MTRALAGPVGVSPGMVRLARELQLMGLLEDVATVARRRYGVSRLVVDRGVDGPTAHISAVIGEVDLVDLWRLDPLLWDDANWAATRLVPEGEVMIVRGADPDA